jgi:hypothetical protein
MKGTETAPADDPGEDREKGVETDVRVLASHQMKDDGSEHEEDQ